MNNLEEIKLKVAKLRAELATEELVLEEALAKNDQQDADAVQFPRLFGEYGEQTGGVVDSFNLGKVFKHVTHEVGKGVSKAANETKKTVRHEVHEGEKGVSDAAGTVKKQVRHEAHTIEHGASHTATQAANKVTDTAKHVGKDIEKGVLTAVNQAKHWATVSEDWAKKAEGKVAYIDGEIQQLENTLEKIIKKNLEKIVIQAAKPLFKELVSIARKALDQPLTFKVGVIRFIYNSISDEIAHLVHYSENFPGNVDQLVQMMVDLSPDEYRLEVAVEAPVVDVGFDFGVGMTKNVIISEIRRITGTKPLPGEPTHRELPPPETAAKQTGFLPDGGKGLVSEHKDDGIPELPNDFKRHGDQRDGIFPGVNLAEDGQPNLHGATLESVQERLAMAEAELTKIRAIVNE